MKQFTRALIMIVLMTAFLGFDLHSASIISGDPQGIHVDKSEILLNADGVFECYFKYHSTNGKILFYADPNQIFWEEINGSYLFIPLGSAFNERSFIGNAVVLSNEPLTSDPIDWNAISLTAEPFAIDYAAVTQTPIYTHYEGDSWQLEFGFSQKETISSKQMASQLTNQLLLVNWNHPITKTYSTKSLVPVEKGKGLTAAHTLKLMPSARTALYNMLQAAKKDGASGYYGTSAYRSVSEQSQLYSKYYNQYLKSYKNKSKAQVATDRRVAKPGTSEHHTGYALDVVSNSGMTTSTFGKTKEFRWLQANAAAYGYIIRYDDSKTDLTKVMDEPWHLRYVGKPFAQLLTDHNWCLEEFHQALKDGQILKISDSNEQQLIFYTKKLPQLTFEAGQLLKYSISNSGTGGYIVTISLLVP